jgi:uncharacterized protein (DUF433 family)
MSSAFAHVRQNFFSSEMTKLLAAEFREGLESREQPVYTLKEAAHYLGVGAQTLSTWFYGRPYMTKSVGEKHWPRVFMPADPDLKLLSFYNLAEAHVLAATRYIHKVPFWAVREAIATVVKAYPAAQEHPLLSDDFFTNGNLLFVEKIAELVNVSSKQLPLTIMKNFIVHVVKDDSGNPFKIYPLRPGENDDRIISIIAGVSASRPVIDASAVPVMAVWRRFKAGESLEFIADDLQLEQPQVQRAIEYVAKRAA